MSRNKKDHALFYLIKSLFYDKLLKIRGLIHNKLLIPKIVFL